MANQTARQAARLKMLEAQARLRRESEEATRRRSRYVAKVVQAVTERDGVVAACEARAGAALKALIEQEGMRPGEASSWTGLAQLSVREVSRLRKLAGEGAGEECDSGQAGVSGTSDAQAPAGGRASSSASAEGVGQAGGVSSSREPVGSGGAA